MARTTFVLGVSLWMLGCGATIGDPCTTAADCYDQQCLNNRPRVPGGYCSKACSLMDDTCPYGSMCVADAAGTGAASCLRTCLRDDECRSGYVCRAEPGGAKAVCLAPL